MTHHIEIVGNRKGFIIKIIFFICLLTFSALLYLESNKPVDMVYFVVVFITFIRFLIMKLY